MIVAENIFVMLLVESFFKTFIKKDLCDATKSTEVLVCLSVDSRQKVDDMVRKAMAAGGIPSNETKDYGFMYQHGFQDLGEHLWELVFMEPSKPFPG